MQLNSLMADRSALLFIELICPLDCLAWLHLITIYARHRLRMHKLLRHSMALRISPPHSLVIGGQLTTAACL